MIKVLPLKTANVKPHFYVESVISINKGDAYETHTKCISDEKQSDCWNYISSEEAENVVKVWKRIAEKAKEPAKKTYAGYFRVLLGEDIRDLVHYLISKDTEHHRMGVYLYSIFQKDYGFSHEDIQDLCELYQKHSDLFDECVEYAYNYLINISIKYVDENGVIHDCEVC